MSLAGNGTQPGWLVATIVLLLFSCDSTFALTQSEDDNLTRADALVAQAEQLRPQLSGSGNPSHAAFQAISRARKLMIDLYTEAIELAPMYAKPLRLRAALHISNNDQDEAIADLLKAIELEPNHSESYLLLARIHSKRPIFDFHKQRHYAVEGLSLLKREYDEQGLQPPAGDLRLVELLFLAQKWTAVVDHCNLAIPKVDQRYQSNQLRKYRGLSLLVLGQNEQAESDFGEIVESRSSPPHQSTQLYYRSLNEALTAKEILKIAQELHLQKAPFWVPPYAWLAYTRAIEKDPSLSEAYAGRAAFSRERRDDLIPSESKQAKLYQEKIWRLMRSELNKSGRKKKPSAAERKAIAAKIQSKHPFVLNQIAPVNKQIAERFFSEELIRGDLKKVRELSPLPDVSDNTTGKSAYPILRVPENAAPEVKQRIEDAATRLALLKRTGEYPAMKETWAKLIADLPEVWSLRFDRYHGMNDLFWLTKDSRYQDPEILLADSLKILERMPKSTRGSTDTAYGWAVDAYDRLGRKDEALVLIEEWIRELPDTQYAVRRRAEIHFSLGHYKQALEDWTASKSGKDEILQLLRAATSETDTLESHLAKSDALFQLGSGPTRIREALTAALVHLPDSALLRAWRAAQYMGEGDYESALRDLEKAIRINPRVAESYAIRAVWRQAHFQFDAALEDYDRAQTLNYQLPEIFSRRAILHYYRGNLEDARFDNALADKLLNSNRFRVERRLMLPQELIPVVHLQLHEHPNSKILSGMADESKPLAMEALECLLRGQLERADTLIRQQLPESKHLSIRNHCVSLLDLVRSSGRHPAKRWGFFSWRAAEGLSENSESEIEFRKSVDDWLSEHSQNSPGMEDLLGFQLENLIKSTKKKSNPSETAVDLLKTKQRSSRAVANHLKSAINVPSRTLEDALYARERVKLTKKIRKGFLSAITFDGERALDYIRDLARTYPTDVEFTTWYESFRQEAGLETSVYTLLAAPNLEADAEARAELLERSRIAAIASILSNMESFSSQKKKSYRVEMATELRKLAESSNDKSRHFKLRSQSCRYAVEVVCESFYVDHSPSFLNRRLESIRYIMTLRPYSPIAGHLAGTYFLYRGDWENAINEFSRSIELDWESDARWFAGIKGLPTLKDTYLLRSVAFTRIGKIDSALSDLDQLLKIVGPNAVVYFRRGELNFKEGRDAQAEVDFLESLEVARESGREEVIRTAIDKLKQPFESQFPNRKEALRFLRKGIALKSRQQLDESMAAIQKGIELWPESGSLHMQHAAVLFDLKRDEEAIVAATKAIKHNSDHPAFQASSYGIRGACHLRMGNVESSDADFQAQIKLDPNQKSWVASIKQQVQRELRASER